MKLNQGKYIYSALVAIGHVIVSPVMVNFNTATPTTPYITYRRNGFTPEYTKDGFTGDATGIYEVVVADNDYTNTVTMAESVVNALTALSHQANTDFRFNQVLLTDLSEDFIEGIYTQTLQFEINTKEI